MADHAGSQIVSRYRRYKAGTLQVTRWLTRTANHHCALSSCLSSFLSLKKNIKSKSQRREVIVVAVRELKTLATIITGAKPQIKVPASILDVLADVISLRKSCAAWYAGQTTDDDSDLRASNERHQFFIKVLGEVQTMLVKLSANDENKQHATANTQASASRKIKKNKKKVDEALSNLFEHLELEEPADEPYCQDIPLERSAASVPDLKHIDIVLESDEADEAIALWAYLQDMNDTRTFVRELWHGYRRGDISLPVAGMITETALGMMRRSCDAFSREHPQFIDWHSIFAYLRLEVAYNDKIVYMFPQCTGGSLGPEFDLATCPTDLLCPAAFLLLRTLPEAIHSALDSGLQRGGYMNATVEALTTPRALTEFESVLFSLLPQICSLFAAEKNYRLSGDPTNKLIADRLPSEFPDLLLDIFRSMDQRPTESIKFPIWMSIALQTAMDIHEALESQASCGGDAVLRNAANTDSSMRECIEFDKSLVPLGSKKSEARRTGYFENVRKVTESDRRMVQGAREIRAPNMPQTEENIALWFNGLHCPGIDLLPHVAGELLHWNRLLVHDIGCGVANDGNSVLSLAHFYRAARAYGLINIAWADMDMLVEQHKGRRPFVTETSAHADVYARLRHYLMDLGVDVTTSVGRAPPVPAQRTTSIAKAKVICPSISVFRSKLKDHYEQNQKFGLGLERGQLFEVVLSALTEDSELRSKSKTSAKGGSRNLFTPTQLLATFKKHLVADEPRVNFDYIGFSRACIKTNMSILTDGLRDVPFERRATMLNTYQSFHHLLKESAEAHAQGKPLGKTGVGVAAVGLRSYIAEHGKDFSQAVLGRSTGSLFKEHRPVFGKTTRNVATDFDALLAKAPGAFASASRTTIEIYDPLGSAEKFEQLLGSPEMAKIRSEAPTDRTHFFKFRE